ncbi:VOC family protein [Pedococcus ginsenosidimutans]|uniref:VOC family protein n=1 Tax=Pedococcus ginsenosidimutans TaxID=490570 RepID=A0ABP8XPE0_9MICO
MPASTAPATLAMTTIDCADPSAEARFWAAALGGEVAHAQDEYAMVTLGEQRIGFGRVEDWTAPEWPNPHGTKQFHFDLAVEDLAAAEAALTGLGATRPADQPSTDWVVLLDPAGHPFCLTKAANWG